MSTSTPTYRSALVRAIHLTLTAGLIFGLLVLSPTDSSANPNGDKRKRRAPTRAVTRTEVKEAEGRLAEMGYGPGRVDGVIDATSRNALIAFQKWEGLKATGALNRDVLDAITNASAPQAKDTGYRHVEVDIDRQVLLMTDDDGVVQRVLPVSSGSNKQYREKGGSGLAYTPRGRFRINAKIAGWRKSPLGLLYYPSYFSGGVAIHGNPSVPNLPESHGCVRIPMSAAIEVSKQLPIGTIVLIYDNRGFVSAKDWAKADREKQEASIR
ncbi:MAG TPA: L,D-transpeptidase family protein [Pyrinomonadaceae bacterium]|nr:L,D-transpeptidase family protein [Pyrinomonadaceae bacterium]